MKDVSENFAVASHRHFLENWKKLIIFKVLQEIVVSCCNKNVQLWLVSQGET